MALFRLDICSLKPKVSKIINHRADDEEQAVSWARKKFRVKRDAILVFPIDDQETAVFRELEKNLGGPLGSPFVDWDGGRVIGLDLGQPLDIFGNLTDDQIEPVRYLRHLRELSLRGNLAITDKGMRIVRPLKRLTNLIVDEMQIGDDCAPYLQGLVGLRTLYLGKGTLKDQGVERRGFFTDDGLGKLKRLGQLFAVSLDYNEVTGLGFDGFERLDAVEHLACTYTRFDDHGIKNLARMPKLKTVDLSYSAITSKGLASLKRLKSLEELYLHGTKTADDGLRQLRGLSKLRYLGLEETRVTARAAKKIQEQLALSR